MLPRINCTLSPHKPSTDLQNTDNEITDNLKFPTIYKGKESYTRKLWILCYFSFQTCCRNSSFFIHSLLHDTEIHAPLFLVKTQLLVNVQCLLYECQVADWIFTSRTIRNKSLSYCWYLCVTEFRKMFPVRILLLMP